MFNNNLVLEILVVISNDAEVLRFCDLKDENSSYLVTNKDGRIELFIPAIDQSLAWKRMMEGENILDTDILLLNHELTEIDFFRNNPGSVYEQAHAAANLDYNWGDAIEDYVELDELY